MKNYNVQLNQNDSRSKIKIGINLATDLVAPTLGAKSRRILIDKEYGDIDASDDGTTILNVINPEDTQTGLGVKVVREASAKTNTDEGDGTTSTAVILRELVNKLIKDSSDDDLLFKKDSGSNLKVRKEIRAGIQKVMDYIDQNKIEITSREQVEQIGRVSSNSDEIGVMLADMFDKIGKNGNVSTVEGNSINTTYEIISGMSFNQGWIAPQFVTDPEREEAVLEPKTSDYVNVLVTSKKIADIKDIEKISELFNAGNNDMLIISEGIEGVPLQSLIINKMRQLIRVIAVKSPRAGNNDMLEDVCAVVGATLVGGPEVNFEDLKPEHLGKAKRVVVTKDKTIIVGTGLYKERVDERLAILTSKLEREKSEYEKKLIQDRIAKLTGGVGSIYVGGATAMEIKDKKSKIIDAVSAVKSALNGGVVAGGGVALLNASSVLSDKIEGENILKKAIEKPFYQILENADLVLKDNLSPNEGYDAETGEKCDMINAGIIDPANVVKAEIRNATSSALMISNLGGAICMVREKNDEVENEKD